MIYLLAILENIRGTSNAMFSLLEFLNPFEIGTKLHKNCNLSHRSFHSHWTVDAPDALPLLVRLDLCLVARACDAGDFGHFDALIPHSLHNVARRAASIAHHSVNLGNNVVI